MTTPEELRVALGAAPSPTTSVPSAGAPTPGVALAGARMPGAPTVPDWDPIALTQVVARMAGDLFAAPPAVGAPSGPDVATPATALPGGTPTIDAAPAAPTPPTAPAVPATPRATPPAEAVGDGAAPSATRSSSGVVIVVIDHDPLEHAEGIVGEDRRRAVQRQQV
ncbi:MAG TPA: hypothetical protein VM734_22155, partial [Kofleriaceae bacterium]|nr:hypothetical protein [Kofleriaceae bacterium]